MATNLEPKLYPRKILLAATGLAPQVLTETIYALAVAGKPSFIPDEIHIVTTADGSDYARHTLLDSGMGCLGNLVRDYGLNGNCRFDETHIHVIPAHDGTALSDIQTPEENLLAANTITELVRRFTRDDDTALHVSIAGGRKTMGFFMGYALSLYGRPQDRLSHVLVSSPFESNHAFYYPPPVPQILFDRNNRPINTADARVILADIPFVRLRTGLPASLIEGQTSFSEAVHAAQSQFIQPTMEVDIVGKHLLCAGKTITMPPIVLAFYTWLAWRKKQGASSVRHTDADPAEFLGLYRKFAGENSADYERAADDLRQGMEKEFFEQKKSLANAALKRMLGLAAMPYLIGPVGRRPLTRYEVGLAASEISIMDTPTETKQ